MINDNYFSRSTTIIIPASRSSIYKFFKIIYRGYALDSTSGGLTSCFCDIFFTFCKFGEIRLKMLLNQLVINNLVEPSAYPHYLFYYFFKKSSRLEMTTEKWPFVTTQNWPPWLKNNLLDVSSPLSRQKNSIVRVDSSATLWQPSGAIN